MLLQHEHFTAKEALLEDRDTFDALADAFQPDMIVHLAAQAGVRHSIDHPRAFLDANITGTFNVMGDAPATWADATLLHQLTGYRPQTDIHEGIARFVTWFRDYHGR